ncbi:MAG: type II toxin-antitoxin system VapC family toxin [Myxococcaceae bacterium]
MFVLDCSVVMAACLSDEASDYADAVLTSLTHQTARVPALWVYEIGNVLLMAERRKRIQTAQRIQYLNSISSLPIKIAKTPSVSQLGSLVSLSQDLGLSLYDASYLDLAVQEKLPLASLDRRLLEAALKIGVPQYRPLV